MGLTHESCPYDPASIEIRVCWLDHLQASDYSLICAHFTLPAPQSGWQWPALQPKRPKYRHNGRIRYDQKRNCSIRIFPVWIQILSRFELSDKLYWPKQSSSPFPSDSALETDCCKKKFERVKFYPHSWKSAGYFLFVLVHVLIDPAQTSFASLVCCSSKTARKKSALFRCPERSCISRRNNTTGKEAFFMIPIFLQMLFRLFRFFLF